MEPIHIYTDGACSGNPGPGGYGAVLVRGKAFRKLSGGYRHTTNNRMELMACIAGLEAIDESEMPVELFTDSTYVRQGITEWIHGWKTKGWKTSQKTLVKNADLWMKLDGLNRSRTVQWHWVRGHNGHPMNELADTLAVAAAAGRNLKEDAETEIDREAENIQGTLF
jgi:ribonuclease HI